MAETIGTQIPTSIPSLTDNADIQAALRLYHYGEDFDHTSSGDLNPESIAGYISAIQADIADINAAGYGSGYSTGSPVNTPPTGVADGYIWVDADSSLASQSGLIAAYQTSAPPSPMLGTLWVDSTDTNDLSLKVYDGTTWKVIV